MHAGKVKPVRVGFRQPDRITWTVHRRLVSQDPAVRTEQRTEDQQLVSVVHRRKRDVGNCGERRRSLTECYERSVVQAGIVALGRLGPLAAGALIVIALLVVTLVVLAFILATPD